MKGSRRLILVVNCHIGFLSDMLSERFDVINAWDPIPDHVREDVEVLVVAGEVPLDRDFVASFPAAKLIACLTAGYDGVDVAWASEKGIQVTRAVAVNNEEVADHAVGVLIAWERGIVAGDHAVRNGEWLPNRKRFTRSLEGLSVGVVGMGAIGKAVSERCAALRMNVAWWGPNRKPWINLPRAESLLDLAGRSDVLVVASSADAGNRNMISGDVIDALGPDGLLINVARGSLVDEDALIDRLRAGDLGGAALDVFASEPTDPAKWVGVPNVILTPHTAGATEKVLPKLIAQLSANIDAYFAGDDLLTPIAA